MSVQTALVKAAFRRVFRNWPLDVEEQRARIANFYRPLPVRKGVVCEPVEAGRVPAEWVTTPGADPEKVLFFLFGGAYVMGSVELHRNMIVWLAGELGMRVFAVEYRLAPEHPFPAALEDAMAAYDWLLAQGVDPAKVVFCGVSAGGGLALATMLKLRDDAQPLPRAAILFSPWTDLANTGESFKTNAITDVVLKPEGLRANARRYAGEHDLKHPLVSPLYADLHDLPPLLIQVSGDELLLDDAARLAGRAQQAGVQVTLQVFPGLFHGFQMAGGMLPENREAAYKMKTFL
jgi:acetyl esterase/lipase